MDLRKTIDSLLSAGGPNAFLVLFDFLEEQGWPAEAWDHILEHVASSKTRIPYTDAWPGLLGHLAATDYPLAVDILTRIDYPRGDYRSRSALVDAINTAHCRAAGRRRGTWQEQLELEQMEWGTMENGNLGPWENLREPDGRVTRRQWTTDFAVEYLQHELEREYGWDAVFHTIYLSPGGNAGPSFDETLRDEQGLWRTVREFDTGEPECPHRGSDEGDNVVLEQTYCGENPGEQCALCEADLGEEHGVVSPSNSVVEVLVLDVLADVDRIEIQELEGERGFAGGWEVFAFADDLEVEIPKIGVAPGPVRTRGYAQEERGVRPFRTGLQRAGDDATFDSLAAARLAVQNFLRELGRPIAVEEFPLEGE